MRWLKDRLVEDWRSAWRWLSVQFASLCTAAAVIYANVDVLQVMLPPKLFAWVMVVLGALTIAGRLTQQKQ